MNDLRGWIPVDIYRATSGQPSDLMPEFMVDWCYLGEERFTDPFFQQTIEWRLRHPFHLLFRPQTPIEILSDLIERQPGVPPTGFIFHLSRCGSTLISRMLAALPQNVVLSEPPPIDNLLRAHLADEQRLTFLRGLVNALGQPRRGDERHFFIKFDSWSVVDLPLIARAFPDVPWLFVYREPVEVMVSHARQRGPQTFPGMLDPQWFGLDPATLFGMDFDEYCARFLGRVCGAALEHRHIGAGRLVNYRELPAAVYELLSGHFHVELTPGERDLLAQAAQLNAKNPILPFTADIEEKQKRASPRLRELAEEWVNPLYLQLEAARAAQPPLI